MQGEQQQAAALFEELYNTAPFDKFVFTLLRDYYVGRGELKPALSMCEEEEFPDALALRPAVDFYELRFVAVERGQVLKALGRHEEGDSLINRARSLIVPERIAADNNLFVVLAMIHTADGDHELALRALRDGVEAGWRYFTNYYLIRSAGFAAMRSSAAFRLLFDGFRALLAAERRRLENAAVAASDAAVSR